MNEILLKECSSYISKLFKIYNSRCTIFYFIFELKSMPWYFTHILGYIIKFVLFFSFTRSTTRINVNIVSKEKTASQYTLLYTYLSSCNVPFSPFFKLFLSFEWNTVFTYYSVFFWWQVFFKCVGLKRYGILYLG